MIDKNKLRTDDDYRYLAMLQIFGKGIGTFAGQPPVKKALAYGLDAVFSWWCKHGVDMPGEPDLIDTAAQVATWTAHLAGYELDTIGEAVEGLKPKWKRSGCRVVDRATGPTRQARTVTTTRRRRR